MKTCCVCGKKIKRYSFCRNCLQYKDTPWAKELLKMQNRSYYLELQDSEVSASDLDLDTRVKLGVFDINW